MKWLLDVISSKIDDEYIVLDGDDHTLCVRERRTGKHFKIRKDNIYEGIQTFKD